MATKSKADPGEAPPPVLSRSTIAPAAGIGVIAAIIAAQEHASWSVSIVVAVTVTLVVVGMIALKRAFHGD